MDFPKTAGQCRYMLALRGSKPVVIATGPAGTGKTMLACHVAMDHIFDTKRTRVILTRPIVAADEDMGTCRERWNERWNHGHDQCLIFLKITCLKYKLKE